jgi:hypothetical protein
MTIATTRTITAALKKAGLAPEIKFISTRDGYHYFTMDDGADIFETHSVYTCYVSDLTVDQWVEVAREFLTEAAAGY